LIPENPGSNFIFVLTPCPLSEEQLNGEGGEEAISEPLIKQITGLT
jgi:hypothetical protein